MKRNMFRIGGLAILTALAAFTWTHAQDSFATPANRNTRNLARPSAPSDELLSPIDSPRPIAESFQRRSAEVPFLQDSNFAQPIPARNAQPSHRPRDPYVSPRDSSAANRTYRMPPNAQQIKISQLREQVLQTNDEEQREEKLTDLQTLLEKSFDDGMKAQGDELAKLEERVAALKKAFERRKTNRDRVIENYVDSVRLQAEGLTIPALGNAAPRRANAVQYRDAPMLEQRRAVTSSTSNTNALPPLLPAATRADSNQNDDIFELPSADDSPRDASDDLFTNGGETDRPSTDDSNEIEPLLDDLPE